MFANRAVRAWRLVGIGLLLGAAASPARAELWVDASAGPGGDGSAARPFATINAALKTAKAAIDAAALCYHARTPPNPFKDAKDIWSTSINLILADDQLTPDELQPLRAATKAFYDAYGCHLE